METYLIIQLSSGHFRAVETLDKQALADLAQQGSLAGPRPDGMLQGLLERSSRVGLLFGMQGDSTNSVSAYLAASLVDDCLHVEEIAVDRCHRRQGRGTALIEAAQAECVGRSLQAITLTTDRFLPSHRSFYNELGFEVSENAGCPPHLLDVILKEHEIFRDPSRRVGMIWRPKSR